MFAFDNKWTNFETVVNVVKFKFKLCHYWHVQKRFNQYLLFLILPVTRPQPKTWPLSESQIQFYCPTVVNLTNQYCTARTGWPQTWKTWSNHGFLRTQKTWGVLCSLRKKL